MKIKIGFLSDRGRDFCILLDFSVHLLFISEISTVEYNSIFWNF